MAKVVQFPGLAPEKLGPQKVRRRPPRKKENPAQLSLFTGRLVSLHQTGVFDAALAADEEGDVVKAKQLYEQAISVNENPADAWCNLGIIEAKQGDAVKAIAAFTHALSLEPRHLEAHYNLANAYAEAGNYALAEIHYRLAIDIAPDFPNSYYNLGLTLALQKSYVQAIDCLTTYCRLTASSEHEQAMEIIRHLQAISA
ncbi:MAG: tetratricopeptide repeat protein [Cyclobacteriaceae bacterium]|nr:tetratricopeptide repeat protein [Cyclobacteriaceae bacterium]